MQETPEQSKKIDQIIGTVNSDITQVKNGLKRIGPRLEKLHKNDLQIEAIMVNGQTVEYAVKIILKSQRAKREVLAILNKPDPYSKIKLADKDIEQPLGGMIDLLKRFNTDKTLIDSLEHFNKKFRKHAIHHAFFTDDPSFKKMEDEIREYLTSEDMKKMVMGLLTAVSIVKKETEDLYQ